MREGLYLKESREKEIHERAYKLGRRSVSLTLELLKEKYKDVLLQGDGEPGTVRPWFLSIGARPRRNFAGKDLKELLDRAEVLAKGEETKGGRRK